MHYFFSLLVCQRRAPAAPQHQSSSPAAGPGTPLKHLPRASQKQKWFRLPSISRSFALLKSPPPPPPPPPPPFAQINPRNLQSLIQTSHSFLFSSLLRTSASLHLWNISSLHSFLHPSPEQTAPAKYPPLTTPSRSSTDRVDREPRTTIQTIKKNSSRSRSPQILTALSIPAFLLETT